MIWFYLAFISKLLYFVLYCTLCCVFVYFYFNPAFGLQLSLIKLSWVELSYICWTIKARHATEASILRGRWFNTLECKCNYIATSNNVIHQFGDWYSGRWWVGCYIWYSEEGTGRVAAPPRSFIAAPNVTAHPSTASVSITVMLYNGPLFCGFNVAVKGLKIRH